MLLQEKESSSTIGYSWGGPGGHRTQKLKSVLDDFTGVWDLGTDQHVRNSQVTFAKGRLLGGMRLMVFKGLDL